MLMQRHVLLQIPVLESGLLHFGDEDLVGVEDVVDEMQLFAGGRVCFARNPGDIKIELAEVLDLCRCFAGMAGVEVHVTILLIKTEDPRSADYCRRTAAKGCAVEFLTVDPFAARPFFHPPAWAGDVADMLDEAPFFMDHDKHGTLGKRVDVRVTAAAGEAQFGVEIVADTGGVEVAVLINLGTAEKAQVNIAALGDAEGVEQPGGAAGPGFAAGVTN